MEALSKMASPYAVIIRENKVKKISTEELVPGDIVLLEAGDIVPADLRLLEAYQLKIDESPLTGESVPVLKQIEPILEKNVSISERKNMAFKGTLVTNGRGKGVVVATGMNTELGKIAKMVQEEETKTPLQKRLADFGKKTRFSHHFYLYSYFCFWHLERRKAFSNASHSNCFSSCCCP